MEDKQESLKSFFKEKGLTQEKVAELLGVSQACANALLTGSKQFGMKQARRFEELFGISETWLLTGKGEMVIGSVIQNNQMVITFTGIRSIIRAKIRLKS